MGGRDDDRNVQHWNGIMARMRSNNIGGELDPQLISHAFLIAQNCT